MTPIKEHAPITNIVAIDLETANPYHSSACAVAGVRFDLATGQITNRMYTLINPQEYFDPFYIGIHEITPEMVKDAPNFAEIWPTIEPLLSGSVLVAHGAGNDLKAVDAAIREYYGMEIKKEDN